MINQIPPIPFGRLIRVEWSKTVGTQAARWLLGASAAAVIAIMAIPLSFPDDIEQTRTSYLSYTGLVIAILLPIVGVLTLTSEWTRRTVLVTFTLEPRRSRVLAAKLVVGLLVGVVGAAYGLGVTFAALGIAEALGRDVTNSDGFAPLVCYVPFVLLNMLMGLAFGAVLHNTAAAISVMFVIPTAWGIIAVAALDTVGRWLDSGQSFAWLLNGTVDEHVWPFVTSMSLWILLPLAVGLRRTIRREVT